MLFNSFEFLFLFLPATGIVYYLSGRFLGARAAAVALTLCSMIFYAYWSRVYLLLILAEVVFCYGIGAVLTSDRLGPPARRALATAGIGVILLVLGYFKYTNFMLQTVSNLTGDTFVRLDIILPLGISFHSFQQIAYLVDAYRRRAPRYDFIRYCLFVTFFPQLIAGPIVHHNELIPQLARPDRMKPRVANIVVGLSIFAVGLFKKTIIADSLAQVANPVFAAAGVHDLAAIDAWCGALAYTFQLYFDFSAYSDMAVGLARLFNLRLPVNFFSPYKAASISDFWRRWHITLSRFLRDYIYIPLGGNRRGSFRKTINLLITMLLGGLWHGAGWTFVVWGGLHGLALVIQAQWFERIGHRYQAYRLYRLGAWLLTFLTVVVCWVFFRAETFSGAVAMLQSMFLIEPASRTTVAPLLSNAPLDGWPLILIAVLIAFLAPNTYQLFRRYRPALTVGALDLRVAATYPRLLGWRVSWRPTLAWSFGTGLVFGLSALAIFGWRSEFLYFQF